MPLDGFANRTSEPGAYYLEVRLLGTGAAAPTKVLGKGITVARTGLGVYTLTLDALPGVYAGLNWGFDGVTPLNLAGCTAVLTTPTAGSKVWTITVYSGGTTPAVRELAATEHLNLQLQFKQLPLAV